MALSGKLVARRRVLQAHQLAHQPVGEIVEIVQPLAQIGIGGAQHAGAGVGLHALDAGFGGEAGADRLAHAVQPAAVMGEHAIGFEHVAVLAAVGDLAALEHARRRRRAWWRSRRRAASVRPARRRR